MKKYLLIGSAVFALALAGAGYFIFSSHSVNHADAFTQAKPEPYPKIIFLPQYTDAAYHQSDYRINGGQLSIDSSGPFTQDFRVVMCLKDHNTSAVQCTYSKWASEAQAPGVSQQIFPPDDHPGYGTGFMASQWWSIWAGGEGMGPWYEQSYFQFQTTTAATDNKLATINLELRPLPEGEVINNVQLGLQFIEDNSTNVGNWDVNGEVPCAPYMAASTIQHPDSAAYTPIGGGTTVSSYADHDTASSQYCGTIIRGSFCDSAQAQYGWTHGNCGDYAALSNSPNYFRIYISGETYNDVGVSNNVPGTMNVSETTSTGTDNQPLEITVKNTGNVPWTTNSASIVPGTESSSACPGSGSGAYECPSSGAAVGSSCTVQVVATSTQFALQHQTGGSFGIGADPAPLQLIGKDTCTVIAGSCQGAYSNPNGFDSLCAEQSYCGQSSGICVVNGNVNSNCGSSNCSAPPNSPLQGCGGQWVSCYGSWVNTKLSGLPSVAPGATGQFMLGSLTVPATPGTYTDNWQMVDLGSYPYDAGTAFGPWIPVTIKVVPKICSGPGCPTINIAPASSTIMLGASQTYTISSQGVTSNCTASGAWSGTVPCNGQQTVTPTSAGTFTYTVTGSNAQGSVSASAVLNVVTSCTGSNCPLMDMEPHESTIILGQTQTYAISSSHVVPPCTKSGDWSGRVDCDGHASVTPTAAGIYHYTVSGSSAQGFSASSSATLTVVTCPGPVCPKCTDPVGCPAVDIEPSTSTIILGHSQIYTLTGKNTVGDCDLSGDWSGSVDCNSQKTVTPAATGTYTYTITGYNGKGASSSSAVLHVVQCPGPDCPYKWGTIIVTSTNAVTGDPIVSSWHLWGPAPTNADPYNMDVCAVPGNSCSGMTATYTNLSTSTTNSYILWQIDGSAGDFYGSPVVICFEGGCPEDQGHLGPEINYTGHFLIKWHPRPGLFATAQPSSAANGIEDISVVNVGAPGSVLGWIATTTYDAGASGWLTPETQSGSITNSGTAHNSAIYTVSLTDSGKNLGPGTYAATINIVGTSSDCATGLCGPYRMRVVYTVPPTNCTGPTCPSISIVPTFNVITLGQTQKYTISANKYVVTPCTASGDWSGTVPCNGTTTTKPTAVGTYVYVVSGADGIGVRMVNGTSAKATLRVDNGNCPSCDAPAMTVTPDSIVASVDSNPPATALKDGITITNSGDPNTMLNWTASTVYDSNGKWFTQSSSSGMLQNAATGGNGASYNLVLTSKAGLADGTYHATTTVTGWGAGMDKQPIDVPITLTVGGGPGGGCSASISIDPSSKDVAAGASQVLTITSKGVATCSMTGDATSTVSCNGTQTVTVGTANRVYTYTVSGPDSSCPAPAVSKLTVSGGGGCTNPNGCSGNCTLTANPALIATPNASTLSYQCSDVGPSTCSITHVDAAGKSGLDAAAGTLSNILSGGSIQVSPTSTSAYTLSCDNGTAGATIKVSNSSIIETNP